MKNNVVKIIAGMALMVLLAQTVSAQWVRTNGPYGGNVMALLVSDSTIWVGLADGGVFRSTSNGTSWFAAGLTDSEITCLAVCGSNVLAGTSGGSVFRSSNNGTSWSKADSGLAADNVWSVNCLAVSGSNIFAGTDAGIYLSNNNGTGWRAVISGLPGLAHLLQFEKIVL